MANGGFDGVEELDALESADDDEGFRRYGSNTKPESDRPPGCGTVQSGAKSITHPRRFRAPPALSRCVNHDAALSAMPSVQTVDDRRREFIVPLCGGG